MAESLALPWGQLPQESAQVVDQTPDRDVFIEQICSGQRIEVCLSAFVRRSHFYIYTGAQNLLIPQVQWQLSHGEEDSQTKVIRHQHKILLIVSCFGLSSINLNTLPFAQWWGAEILNQPHDDQKCLWKLR